MTARTAKPLLTSELLAYVDNLRGLLGADDGRWRGVVERQILATLLPRVSGNRATLEPALWSLLILCLDGHEVPVPAATDSAWEKALTAARRGQRFDAPIPAPYPRAAAAVADTLVALRETGVVPRPHAAAP